MHKEKLMKKNNINCTWYLICPCISDDAYQLQGRPTYSDIESNYPVHIEFRSQNPQT